jgi:acetyl-CoA acetyltransferase
MDLAGQAILAAVADAGLTIRDIDGFALFAPKSFDVSLAVQQLGIPHVRFAAAVSGAGGGGSAGAVGLAASAVVSGAANVIVTVLAVQQPDTARIGAVFSGSTGTYQPPGAERDFVAFTGLVGPGQMFAMQAMRHMHLYGTTRAHLAEVAVATRSNAVNRPSALMRSPLTADDYFRARMIADPLCLLDFCLESDGAVAVVTTSSERAKDLPHPPVYIRASATGGTAGWGQGMTWMGMDDDVFASSGHREVAAETWSRAGLGPADVDVALLYDHFTISVLAQLEDYGFCPIGESGPFVADGHIRFRSGSIPINPHGGHLSEGYLMGMTHIVEAVSQLRGTALNQVTGAEVALVTGGPSPLPVSSLILRR